MGKIKLVRSKDDKKLAGVVAGLASMFKMDTTLLRVIVALTVFFTGIFPGLIAYIICAAIIPEENNIIDMPDDEENK